MRKKHDDRILYHGTLSRFLDSIQRHGLRPRELAGVSNYNDDLISPEGVVFLSDVYPLHYANVAVKKHGGDLAVAVVVVSEPDLLPDNDFAPGGRHDAGVTTGRDSLENYGCACIRGVVRPFELYVVPPDKAKAI
jgi:hypothetical protein